MKFHLSGLLALSLAAILSCTGTGSGEYILTVPLFRKATLCPGNGKILTVTTDNSAAARRFFSEQDKQKPVSP